ncbi:MAG: M48 family metallopeptidase [Oligoflexales bacterium]|nr:M48 family metallopeptidase [Oligoflexales bacterium]
MIESLNIEIEHSAKRKNPAIEILPGQIVKVIVPEGYGQLQVNALIKKKTNWIVEKLREVKDFPAHRKREFISGESFPLLGKEYRLKVIKGHVGPAKQEGDRLLANSMSGIASDVEKEVIEFYKSIAKEKLELRVKYFANKLALEPKEIRVGDFKSQWGSCTPDGVISFNWQIIAAPSSVVDYVVVHELCHLKHLNHSKEFWVLVASVLPSYKEMKNKLKNFSFLM